MSKFLNDTDYDDEALHAGVQWKGTKVCMDFQCECGANCHSDAWGVYLVQCPHCGVVWEMPTILIPRKATLERIAELTSPVALEPDEDYSDEVVDLDGVTVLVPRIVQS
jgi:hypothetical protein